jgi:hypothetical protein
MSVILGGSRSLIWFMVFQIKQGQVILSVLSVMLILYWLISVWHYWGTRKFACVWGGLGCPISSYSTSFLLLVRWACIIPCWTDSLWGPWIGWCWMVMVAGFSLGFSWHFSFGCELWNAWSPRNSMFCESAQLMVWFYIKQNSYCSILNLITKSW